MLAIILAMAATLSPVEKLVDIQMRIGMCEAHLAGDRVAHFDPFTSPVPRAVQELMHQARVEGRDLARKHPLRASECNRLLNELPR